MGWRIAEEVQEHAPTSLTWRELYVACVLANDANENTRVCRPGLLTDERLMRRLRMTDKREILRVIERLAEAKVIERVTRGQKGQQAEFRFLSLGPARPAQGGESAHPEAGQSRPQGGESTHPEAGSGWVVSPLRVGDSPAQGGGNTHPSQGPNEDQESSLLPPQRILRAAGIALGEDDEKRFIEWTNRKDHKGTPWWRTVAKNGDLPGLVEEWRASLTATAPSNGTKASWRDTEPCGTCDPTDRTRTTPDGRLYPCPTCNHQRHTDHINRHGDWRTQEQREEDDWYHQLWDWEQAKRRGEYRPRPVNAPAHLYEGLI